MKETNLTKMQMSSELIKLENKVWMKLSFSYLLAAKYSK